MENTIVSLRSGRSIITFDQSCVPEKFFAIAKEFGYKIRVTGNLTLTHDIECGIKDFHTLVDMCVS